MSEEILSKKTFSARIEDLVKESPMPYMDAILICSSSIGMEPEAAGRLINKNIKEKLEAEAQDLNMMQRSAKLPL